MTEIWALSALFGLSRQIISQAQVSSLAAAPIASAVAPTLISDAVFPPRRLPPRRQEEAAPSLRQPERGGLL